MCPTHGEPGAMGPLILPSADETAPAKHSWAPRATSPETNDILISIFHALERRNLLVSAQGPALITSGKPPPYPVFSFSSNLAVGPGRPLHECRAV